MSTSHPWLHCYIHIARSRQCGQNSLLALLRRIRQHLLSDARRKTKSSIEKFLKQGPHSRNEACLLRSQNDSHCPHDGQAETQRQPSRRAIVQDHSVGLQLDSQAQCLAFSSTERGAQDLRRNRLSEFTNNDPRGELRQAWSDFMGYCRRDLDSAEQRGQNREMPDLMQRDKRTRVRYDRGHASRTAF